MRVFLFLLSLVSFLAGSSVLLGASSAIHEIEAFVLFLIAATLLSGAAVVEGLNRRRKDSIKVEELLEKIAKKLDDQAPFVKKACDAIARESSLPPLPGQERYFLSIDDNVQGPYLLSEIQELVSRGSVDQRSKILKEGTKLWQSIELATQ